MHGEIVRRVIRRGETYGHEICAYCGGDAYLGVCPYDGQDYVYAEERTAAEDRYLDEWRWIDD